MVYSARASGQSIGEDMCKEEGKEYEDQEADTEACAHVQRQSDLGSHVQYSNGEREGGKGIRKTERRV